MKPEEVLAVVVSFNGLHQTREAVEALRAQVGHVLVVDNGSAADSLAVLAELECAENVAVVRLAGNTGVGHALNIGVRMAKAKGCAWLLTMDQDGVIDGDFVAAYRAAVDQDANRVCLAPEIVDHGRGRSDTMRVVTYAITSGNLVRVDLFERVGLYDEGFFVDCIDFDFSLRVRRAGYSVHRIPGAVMRHRLGESVNVPEFVRRIYASHAPVRRYYATRNYLYLAERYLLRFPWFIIKLGLLHLLLTVLVGFLDRHPIDSYRASGRGFFDYLRRRIGQYIETSR